MCALGILLHIYKNPVSTGYFLNIYPKAVYTKNFLTFAHTFIPIHPFTLKITYKQKPKLTKPDVFS